MKTVLKILGKWLIQTDGFMWKVYIIPPTFLIELLLVKRVSENVLLGQRFSMRKMLLNVGRV